MSAQNTSATGTGDDPGDRLLELYDTAMPEVYGYLHRRCRNRTIAEDLTTEVFLAAVESVGRDVVTEVTTAWLIGIARHKLVDHWRRLDREQRRLEAVRSEPTQRTADDNWNIRLDALVAYDVLDELGEHHRCALTLRYVDDLSVKQVAELLGRTEHATEALLVRARRAFRTRYEEVTP